MCKLTIRLVDSISFKTYLMFRTKVIFQRLHVFASETDDNFTEFANRSVSVRPNLQEKVND